MTAQHSSAESRWRTPQNIIDLAHTVLRGIDLDPASDPGANEFVRARRIITAQDNALECDWDCKGESIFLNPPGGKTGNKSNAVLFWQKLMKQKLIMRHAIFIGFNIEILRSTQGQAYYSAIEFPFCVPAQRLRFVHPEGKKVASPTHANVIVYIPGRDNKSIEFVNHFSSLGECKE